MKRTITLDKDTYLYLIRVINRVVYDVDSAVSYVANNPGDEVSCPSFFKERSDIAAEQFKIHSLFDVVLFGE